MSFAPLSPRCLRPLVQHARQFPNPALRNRLSDGASGVNQSRLCARNKSISTAPTSRTVNQPGAWHARPSSRFDSAGIAAAVAATVFVLLGGLLTTNRSTRAEAPADSENFIRLHEIQEHNRQADTYWVYRGNRVYDITEWIPNHPGGEVIMRAVGGSIEPYWNIFTIHQKQDVYDILEQYFIGLIDPRDLVDGKAPADQIEDPFKSDPARDEALTVHSERPFNAETPVADLQSFITPVNRFYKRHHLWVPQVDEETFKLTIELPDGEEAEYSVEDLRRKFKAHTITATMQCSGNRRSHMTEGSSPTNGIQWGVGAISNASWTGVRMLDVLQDAGLNITDLPDDVKHVQFVGAEAYGASIPIDKAIDRFGDVLLVYEMNGQPLQRDHGFPLRALVPGTVAARSVKWLNKIVLSDEESTSQWQRRDYKCFGPNEGGNPDWDRAAAIQETPVQSAITSVRKVTANRLENSQLARVYGLEEESVVLRGYAFSGAGRRIVRVDISPDDGKTWQQAELETPAEGEGSQGHRAWSWQLWSLAVPVRMLSRNICVKASDEGYNTQPETFAPYFNFRGNLANSWHRLPVSEALNAPVVRQE